MLTDKIKSEIKEFSLTNREEESCGVLVSIGDEVITYKSKNISFHKSKHAILNPLDYIRAAKLGKIIAHFHSQPCGAPSFTDYLNAINHNIYSIIYSIKRDIFYIIEPKLKDYLDLDYQCGISDCYTLVREYFNKELNIKLNDYNREDNWWKNSPNLILENFKKEGGIPVSFGDIRPNDVIVFNVNNIPGHFSIYIGSGLILHHPFEEKSIISEISEPLKKRICMVIRHKDLFNEH